jgi:uncharacterized membrane protein YeiH
LIGGIGGGLVRDIIARVEPLMLKPGQYAVLAAPPGNILFVAHTIGKSLSMPETARVAINALFMKCRRYRLRNTPMRAARPIAEIETDGIALQSVFF